MQLMARYEDNYFDLAIVDPPYGLERFKKGGSLINKYGTEKQKWNNTKPNEYYFKELFRVSQKQIIWGANNFILPTSEYFIIWQKGNALDFSFAMVEQAWTNIKKPAKLLKHLHTQNKDKRIHPTQKPVKLYEWLLMNYAKEGDKILDTHLGSGSIAIACHNLGYDLTACELDKEYYEAAIKRIEQHKAQIRMLQQSTNKNVLKKNKFVYILVT
jgi:site-specific DNA-methyltransferase (adenine-specific)